VELLKLGDGNMKNVSKLVLSVVAGFALATLPLYAEGEIQKAADEVTDSVKTTFYDVMDKDITTVDFEKGSAVLSEAEKSDLKAMVAAVKSDTTINNVIVAAWSDEEYPKTKGEKLSQAEQDLANKRATNVEAELKTLGLNKIETHSMAENPGWLARTFSTKDATLKGEGRGRNASDKEVMKIGQDLRDKGGPGKVVVFIRRTTDPTAH
jgi:hypothetical protein